MIWNNTFYPFPDLYLIEWTFHDGPTGKRLVHKINYDYKMQADPTTCQQIAFYVGEGQHIYVNEDGRKCEPLIDGTFTPTYFDKYKESYDVGIIKTYAEGKITRWCMGTPDFNKYIITPMIVEPEQSVPLVYDDNLFVLQGRGSIDDRIVSKYDNIKVVSDGHVIQAISRLYMLNIRRNL